MQGLSLEILPSQTKGQVEKERPVNIGFGGIK